MTTAFASTVLVLTFVVVTGSDAVAQDGQGRSVASVLESRGDEYVQKHRYRLAAVEFENASALKSVETSQRQELQAKSRLALGMAAAQVEMKKFTKVGSPQEAEKLSKAMIAPLEICQKVFEPELAALAAAEYAKERLDIFGGAPMSIEVSPEYSELHVSAALSEDLNTRSKTAKNFAGGWQRVAGQMKPGFTFYRISFVRPGQTSGMSYDGFVQVDGKWYAFPKVWRLAK
ncbi:MAG: hypothetical protein WBD20_02465 [Pirellulaceae bacterium]